MTQAQITDADQRLPVDAYRYWARGETQNPLGDDESLAWLADQLCSEERVHPERTMATGWIPYQAALEFPGVWDRLQAATQATAEADARVNKQAEFIEAKINQLAEADAWVKKACDLLRRCLPEGVCVTNPNVPDDTNVALNAPYGDLRAIHEFLTEIDAHLSGESRD